MENSINAARLVCGCAFDLKETQLAGTSTANCNSAKVYKDTPSHLQVQL